MPALNNLETDSPPAFSIAQDGLRSRRRTIATGAMLACGLMFYLAACGLKAADAPPVKRVLMLFSEGKDLPVNVMVERAAKAELQSHSTNRIEFYAEHLDAIRFPGESYYKLFREYLREKYAQRPP